MTVTAPPNIDERVLELRNGTMTTRVLVGGQGEPLLYLHGAGGLMWDPFIQALAGVAVDKGVPFHSIIGDRGLGDGEQGSDGVVPYKSAHLVGAESELIVPSDHAATAHPLTVLEIKRLLQLHLLPAGLFSS